MAAQFLDNDDTFVYRSQHKKKGNNKNRVAIVLYKHVAIINCKNMP
jgi:hypothetical protein